MAADRKIIDRVSFGDYATQTGYDLMNCQIFIAPNEFGRPTLFYVADTYYAMDMHNDQIVPLDTFVNDDQIVIVTGYQGINLSERQKAVIRMYQICGNAAMSTYYKLMERRGYGIGKENVNDDDETKPDF